MTLGSDGCCKATGSSSGDPRGFRPLHIETSLPPVVQLDPAVKLCELSSNNRISLYLGREPRDIRATPCSLYSTSHRSRSQRVFASSVIICRSTIRRICSLERDKDSALRRSLAPPGRVVHSAVSGGSVAIRAARQSWQTCHVVSASPALGLLLHLVSFCRETPEFVLGCLTSPIKPGQTDG